VKRLEDLGERAAIRQIEKILSQGKNTLGIGDDCAAIDLGNNYLLVTTDMMSHRTHIPPYMTPYQMGWFLVAINLSDIAAKGGAPLGLVCSFGLPKRTTEMFLKELTKGANACAVRFGTRIVGGDTKETTEITLCATALGTVKKDEYMPRLGTHPGDVVAVTGRVGSAGAGYYALKQNTKKKKLSKAFLEPYPRLKEGRLLAKLRVVTSAMDLSDGLSASLYQLQETNSVGFEINKFALPLVPALNQSFQKIYGISPYDVALHFGGDYELLVTIPQKKFEQTKKRLQRQGFLLTAIGAVTRKKNIILLENGTKRTLPNKGYEHFKKHFFS